MKTTRRVFLKQGAFALAAVGIAPAFGPAFLRNTVFAAEPARDDKSTFGRKVLVCIFQRGAVDGLSMVVPHGDPNYYQFRSVDNNGIAIARTGENGVIDLDGHFGLNPALAALKPIFDSGHLAPIQACGSPNATRSHFDAQDYMELAMFNKNAGAGWLTRTIQNCPEDQAKIASAFRSVSMTSVLPLSLRGSDSLAIPNLNTFDVGSGMAMPSAQKKSDSNGFESLYDDAVGDVLHGAGNDTFDALKQLRSIRAAKYVPAGGAQYPRNDLGQALMQIAQLIKSNVGLEVAFAETGGWDTHHNQGGASGQLARNLKGFGDALAAFYQDMGDRMADVTVLTMSEFGRTVRQNGTGGTDHGHANCFFAMGGDVAGGKVLGNWPGLAPEQLYQNRDLQVTTDFRNVFAEMAQKQMGVRDLKTVFPDFAVSPQNYRKILRA